MIKILIFVTILLILSIILVISLNFADKLVDFTIKRHFYSKKSPISKENLRKIKFYYPDLYNTISRIMSYDSYRLLFIWLEHLNLMTPLLDYLTWQQDWQKDISQRIFFIDSLVLTERFFFLNPPIGYTYTKPITYWDDARKLYIQYLESFLNKNNEKLFVFKESANKAFDILRAEKSKLIKIKGNDIAVDPM